MTATCCVDQHATHRQITLRALAIFLHVHLPSGSNQVSHSKCKASGLLHVHWCGLCLLWHCMSMFLVSRWSTANHSGVSVFKNKANQMQIWTQAYASFWVRVQVDMCISVKRSFPLLCLMLWSCLLNPVLSQMVYFSSALTLPVIIVCFKDICWLIQPVLLAAT